MAVFVCLFVVCQCYNGQAKNNQPCTEVATGTRENGNSDRVIDIKISESLEELSGSFGIDGISAGVGCVVE